MTHPEDQDGVLHQPPNGADEQAFALLPLLCRRTRERLRDFADADLSQEERKLVELHAHDCRACSVELARAEFEALRIRRAFSESWEQASPPTGFARRTLARLLRESPEFALLPDAGATSSPAGHPAGSPSGKAPKGLVRNVLARTTAELLAGSEQRSARVRAQWVAAVALSLTVVTAIAGAFWRSMAELTANVRLAVVRAERGFRETHAGLAELLPGDGLGEGAVLRLHEQGAVDVEWYDAAVVGEQPAAQIRLTGDTELRVEQQLGLEHGAMEVLSHRPMAIELADGSRIELGSGLYRIQAMDRVGPFDEVPSSGGDLAVEVVVERGDSARLEHATGTAAVVTVGQAGSFTRGFSGIAVENRPGTSFATGPLAGSPRTEAPVEAPPDLSGLVVDAFGSPLAHATVRIAYPTANGLVSRELNTDHAGHYVVPAGSGMLPGYALLEVSPPPGRADLAFAPTTAYPLAADGERFLTQSIVLGSGARLQGRVEGSGGNPRPYARVVPVFYDEALGQVWPWMQGAVWSGEDGGFSFVGLPTQLGAMRTLGAVAFHPEDEPTFVPLARPGIADASTARIELFPQAAVTIRGLPASRSSSILEEVRGLPPGLGVRRHLVTANAAGEALGVLLGRGRLWLEVEGSNRNLLQPLSRSAAGFADVAGEQIERSMAMVPMLAVPGILGNQLELATQTRFLDADVEPAVGEDLVVQAPSGGLVGGVELFALRARVGGGVSSRFLGLSRVGNALRVHLRQGETEILALDVSTGMYLRRDALALRGGVAHGRLLPLALERMGRAELASVLAPAVESIATTWSPLTAGSAGGRAPLFRQLRVSEHWAAESLPPGDYQVRDQLQRSFRVRVLAGQTTTIR